MQRDATSVNVPALSPSRSAALSLPVNKPGFLERLENSLYEFDSLFPGHHPIQTLGDVAVSSIIEAPTEFAKGNYLTGLAELLQLPSLFLGVPVPLAPERYFHETYMKNKERYNNSDLNMERYVKPYSNIFDERRKKSQGKK